MKVRECKKCVHCKIKRWIDLYAENQYTPVVVRMPFAWCGFYKKRASSIKKCNKFVTKEG